MFNELDFSLIRGASPGHIQMTQPTKHEDGFLYNELLKQYHVVHEPLIVSEVMLIEKLKNTDVESLVKSCQRVVEDINRTKNLNQNTPRATSIISFDNVSCFYYPQWPEIAKDWLTRDRQWPSKKVVKEIVAKGSYIVAKQSSPEESHRFEWRYSFSLAEI